MQYRTPAQASPKTVATEGHKEWDGESIPFSTLEGSEHAPTRPSSRSRRIRLFSTFVAAACSTLLLGATTLAAPPAEARAITHRLDIPAQDLGAALKAFGAAANEQVLFSDDVVAGLHSPQLKGEYSTDEAVTLLLKGSGLKADRTPSGVLLIRSPESSSPKGISSSLLHGEEMVPQAADEGAPLSLQGRGAGGEGTPATGKEKKSFWQRFRLAQADTSSRSEEENKNPSSRENEKKVIELEEVVVTGTHIRGSRPSSPIVTITQEDMRLSGHNTLGEALRALPQNFAGGQNPGVALGASAGGIGNQNSTGGSSLNLRGLGSDATLTLLNGVRLPYDGFAQATDVSVIPVAAIERIEVLLDGASAIYGSDAVGGVTNIILKRDYHGAELAVRYGAATDGGDAQTQYTGVAGRSWVSGGFLVTGDVSNNTEVHVRQRDYLAHMPRQEATVHPNTRQKGVLLSGHQALGSFAEVALDAFYTQRDQTLLQQGSLTTNFASDKDSTVWGVSPSLRVTLAGDWSLRLHGSFGQNDAEAGVTGFSIATGAQTSASAAGYDNKGESGGVEAEGALFALPGGKARLSVGGGYRRSSFRNDNLVTGQTSVSGVNRSHYGYGEIHLPLVRALSVSGALRHEKYNTFGETTTPKIGAIWSVTPSFDIKGSWGKSFKAPTLLQQYQAQLLYLYSASAIGGAAVSAPAGSTAFRRFGGNPDLDAEHAEVVTVGFVARPSLLPGFSLEFSWFDIDYTDRVVLPISPIGQALSNPAFAEFVSLNPTPAERDAAFAWAGLPVGTFSGNFAGAAYDPTRVIAVIDDFYTNVAAQTLRGIDLSARYAADAFGGRLSLNGDGSWITDSTRKLTSLAPEILTAGVVYFPPKFKGRLGAAWSRGGLTLSSNVNYIGGVRNTNITPNPRGGSMTTLDVVVDYEMQSARLGNVRFDVAATNIFNKRPPFLQPQFAYYVNYDSTNYSPLGRVVSATVSKRF